MNHRELNTAQNNHIPENIHNLETLLTAYYSKHIWFYAPKPDTQCVPHGLKHKVVYDIASVW